MTLSSEPDTGKTALFAHHAAPVAIADLKPEVDHIEQHYVDATVALIWPYSSSIGKLSLLLAEKDIRSRKLGGQIRVTFHGACAREVARTRVGIGDTLKLALEDATFDVPNEEISTPGKKAGWDVNIRRRVRLEVNHNHETVFVDYTADASSPRVSSPPTLPSNGFHVNNSINVLKAGSYAFRQLSPFKTPKRVSSGSFTEATLDPFADDDGYITGKGRKRTKFSRDSGSWRLLDDEADDSVETTTESSLDIPRTMKSSEDSKAATQEKTVQRADTPEITSEVIDNNNDVTELPAQASIGETVLTGLEAVPEEHAIANTETISLPSTASPQIELRKLDVIEEPPITPLRIDTNTATGTVMGPPTSSPIARRQKNDLSSASADATMSKPRLMPIPSPGLPLVSPLIKRSGVMTSSYFPDVSPIQPHSLDQFNTELHDMPVQDDVSVTSVDGVAMLEAVPQQDPATPSMTDPLSFEESAALNEEHGDPDLSEAGVDLDALQRQIDEDADGLAVVASMSQSVVEDEDMYGPPVSVLNQTSPRVARSSSSQFDPNERSLSDIEGEPSAGGLDTHDDHLLAGRTSSIDLPHSYAVDGATDRYENETERVSLRERSKLAEVAQRDAEIVDLLSSSSPDSSRDDDDSISGESEVEHEEPESEEDDESEEDEAGEFSEAEGISDQAVKLASEALDDDKLEPDPDADEEVAMEQNQGLGGEKISLDPALSSVGRIGEQDPESDAIRTEAKVGGPDVTMEQDSPAPVESELRNERMLKNQDEAAEAMPEQIVGEVEMTSPPPQAVEDIESEEQKYGQQNTVPEFQPSKPLPQTVAAEQASDVADVNANSTINVDSLEKTRTDYQPLNLVTETTLITPIATQDEPSTSLNVPPIQETRHPLQADFPLTPDLTQNRDEADMSHAFASQQELPLFQEVEMTYDLPEPPSMPATAPAKSRRTSERLSRRYISSDPITNEYFTPRHSTRTNRQSSPAKKENVPLQETPTAATTGKRSIRQKSPTKIVGPDKEPSAPTASQSLVLKAGTTTSLSYYPQLSDLSSYFGHEVDVLAICTTGSSLAEKATLGPKDYYTSLHLADQSFSAEQQNDNMTVTAQLFRPRKSALPNVHRGDVILLRNMKVQTQNHKMMLLSTDSSAWAVMRPTFFGEFNIVIVGPPVEHDKGEIEYARTLTKWWSEDGAKAYHDLPITESVIPDQSNIPNDVEHQARAPKEENAIIETTSSPPHQATPQVRRSQRRQANRTDNIGNAMDTEQDTSFLLPSSRRSSIVETTIEVHDFAKSGSQSSPVSRSRRSTTQPTSPTVVTRQSARQRRQQQREDSVHNRNRSESVTHELRDGTTYVDK